MFDQSVLTRQATALPACNVTPRFLVSLVPLPMMSTVYLKFTKMSVCNERLKIATVFKILVAFHLGRSPLSDAKNLTGVRNFGKTTPGVNMSSSVSFTFLEIPCLRLMQIH